MSRLKMNFGIAMILSAAIVLSACGNKGGNTISDGVSSMKAVLTEVQSAVNAGDAAKTQTEAANLENAWAKFEDDVKEKSKDLYEKAETPLHAIEAGSEVEPLDQDALTKSITEMNQVLDEIIK